MLSSLVMFDFSALAAAATFKFSDFSCFDSVVAPPWSSAIAASNFPSWKGLWRLSLGGRWGGMVHSYNHNSQLVV